MRRTSVVAVIVAVLVASAPRAEAITFHDAPAFAQRVAQFTQYLIQWRQIIGAARDHLAAFRSAYEGMKDWKSFGWLDTLDIVNMPWFDGVEGIDEVRNVTFHTVMSVDQAIALWDDADSLSKLKSNSRYRTDPWYRAKVDSLFRQSKRARAQRAALLRQMQAQNRALIEDVKKIKRLRDEIEKANKEKPVNQAKVTSLQAELAAVEAKYQGENIMLANQRAIMFLVGEDEAQRSYIETRDNGWIEQNKRGMRELGRGFAR